MEADVGSGCDTSLSKLQGLSHPLGIVVKIVPIAAFITALGMVVWCTWHGVPYPRNWRRLDNNWAQLGVIACGDVVVCLSYNL